MLGEIVGRMAEAGGAEAAATAAAAPALLLSAGLVVGMAHALDPDHVVAMLASGHGRRQDAGRGGGRGAAAAAGRGAAPAPALVLITRYQMRAGRHACRGEEAGRSGFGRYMSERVGPHHRDERGAARAALAFGDVVATGFAAVGVGSAALPRPPPPPADAWRVGESLAECFLEDHEGASFPYPYSRDQRNPLASPAGPDLAGYYADGGETVFLFGEVKTTNDKSRPPSVVRDLRRQTEMLRPGENRPVF